MDAFSQTETRCDAENNVHWSVYELFGVSVRMLSSLMFPEHFFMKNYIVEHA